MKPLSAIAHMQRWNYLQDQLAIQRADVRYLEERRLEKIRIEERYDRYRTTTIEEVAQQLEANRKLNAPIDIWV
jgi:hypothetical protein